MGCPVPPRREGQQKHSGEPVAGRDSAGWVGRQYFPLYWYSGVLGADAGGRQKIRSSSPLNVPESPMTKLVLQQFIYSQFDFSWAGYRQRRITNYTDIAQLRLWGALL